MPDPAKLLPILTRAAATFRATPGRTGRVVALTDATDMLVGGDLHGHLGNFQALMKRADLANHPRRHLVLQEAIHGPFRYPDGGDKSHQMLDLIAALCCQFPGRVHFLPGNHELAQATGRAILKGDDFYNESVHSRHRGRVRRSRRQSVRRLFRYDRCGSAGGPHGEPHFREP